MGAASFFRMNFCEREVNINNKTIYFTKICCLYYVKIRTFGFSTEGKN